MSVSFLARAAREYTRGGWVFTGFHWPVLAGETAARLAPDRFAQVFEAGGTAHGPADELPTSTTDFAALGGALVWRGTTAAVFGGIVRRADRVVLDAANVDIHGAVNATAVGPYERPRVRLPGGGGAADAAARAQELVLLYAAPSAERITAAVEHVTARPGAEATVRLVTRWGVVRLDVDPPRLVEVDLNVPGTDAALDRLAGLSVRIDGAGEWAAPTGAELAAATQVLELAAQRGYVVARRALTEMVHDVGGDRCLT
jgi:glutaconate CoA-transferase subunit B